MIEPIQEAALLVRLPYIYEFEIFSGDAVQVQRQ